MTVEQRLDAAAADYFDGEPAVAVIDAVRRRLALRQSRGGQECTRCRRWKPTAAFSRDSREHSGIRRYCRVCDHRRA